jgi:GTPase SAR1 family protein
MEEPNPPENRNINTGGGNYNEQIKGDYIQGNVFKWIINIFIGRKHSTESPNSRNRFQQMLLQQVSTEVESRINSSLHNRVYIVLDTEQNPSQVECPWQIEVKVGSQPKIILHNTEITTVFDQPEITGRLLILGQPGSGKTTMLLKLAEELVKRANNDPAQPVPVLFSLPSWKNNKQSIKDWLIDQLKEKYGVRKDIGKQWVENQEILPLLDGLDELAAERQELCVSKINNFLHPSNWAKPLVICSRIEEYERYQTLLQLNNSLELSPLTSEQVYQYLKSTGSLQLYPSVSQDEDLSQLAKIPFLLTIVALSAKEISVETWQNITDSQERLDYLFDAYINRMLKRYYSGKQPKSQSTVHWLGWLAQKLTQENKTEFSIEQMQPSWLLTQKPGYEIITWNVINLLIFSLINGIFLAIYYMYSITFDIEIFNMIFFFIIIHWLFFGLFFGLIIAVIISFNPNLVNGFVSNLTQDKIQHIEKIKFSIGRLINGLKMGMYSWWMNRRRYGLLFVFDDLFMQLFEGLTYGFYGLEVESKTIPNQGIRLSFINTIIISAISTLLAALLLIIILIIVEIIKFYTNKNYEITPIDFYSIVVVLIFLLGVALPFGILIGIQVSGKPAIKHLILRVFLWSSGYTPWNYAKFLNYSTNRLFLQRVGGSYRFVHDLLRQHFAKKYLAMSIKK